MVAMKIYKAPNGSLSYYKDGDQPEGWTVYEPTKEAAKAETKAKAPANKARKTANK